MLTTVAVLSVLTIAGGAPASAPHALASRARVQVWTNRAEDPYASGQSVQVYFRTDQDAYVTILRVDTDGRVRVLFPRDPWEDNFARGGHEYEVLDRFNRPAFVIDDYPGEGYIFAVSAPDPFVYAGIESGDHWDYRVIADGRVRGDPYVALTDLAQRIVPEGYSDWDYDMVPYYVQQHYDYPRFLCYDCHAYASYPYWSAYDYTCTRFRMVEYDDPYYYPYAYGGTQVVFTRPLRPEPRFIFKDRQQGDAFFTRVRARPADRAQDAGVRGRDLGGTGIVPRPRGGHPGSGDQGGGDQPGRDRSGQPSHRDRPDQPGRDRSGQPSHPDRPDQPGRDRSGQPSHPDRPDQPSHDRADQGHGALRPDNSAVPTRPDRPAVGYRSSPTDRPSDRLNGGGPTARPGRDNTPDGGGRSTPPPQIRREPAPPPRNEPRVERAPEPPRAQPAPAPQPAPRGEPELKRRKP
ncbi:MAG TPA: DUF4384 domain-containing protein [Gemmatimonadales bacterium]|nr:DUF4384 domain-containing protein [Gemmatimonadales bacterium]